MKMKKPIFILLLSAVGLTALNAQDKTPLDHSVYDSWESLGNISIPYNGKYLIYSVNPQEGDNILTLFDLQKNEKKELPRGKDAVISINGQQAVYRISPTFKQTHDAKAEKKKEPEMPKDTLAVMNLKSGADTLIPYLSTLKYGRELISHIAFNLEKPGKKDSLSPLFVMDINTFAIDTINMVEKFDISDDGAYLAYITKPGKKDSITVRGLYLRNLKTKETKALLTGEKKMKVELPFFEEDGSRLAFYAQQDTAKAVQKYSDIYFYDIASANGQQASLLVNSSTEGLRDGWMVGEKGRLRFFKDVLLIGTKPIPAEEDTTIAEFEKVKLDIWKWNADYLPTVIEARKDMFENKTYLAAVSISGTAKIVQIADEQLPDVTIPEELKGEFVFAKTDKPYLIQQQWSEYPHYDLYKINISTGDRELVMKDTPYGRMSASPYGSFYLFYDIVNRKWLIFETATGVSRDITSSLGVGFWNDENDVPALPDACSYPVWSENEKYFLLGDKYDLWQFDPLGTVAPFTITEGLGRKTETTFTLTRPIYDPKAKARRFGNPLPIKSGEPLYFSSFNHKSRHSGYYMKDITKKKAKMTSLEEGPYHYGFLGVSLSYEYPGIASVSKSNKPPRKLSIPIYATVKGDFQHSYNIFVSRDFFRTSNMVSNTNPQQANYNWGTVEMVSWMTDDSIPAEGLLFKPENFDPSKKYPVIIYFYEKYSETIFEYRNPAPSRSIVNIPYFVSNGYLVFVPDIYYGKPGSGQYLDGNPGECAMRSIMPGVDMLCRNPWVDSAHMAIQGQSWGGYQVAYMITKTDRFAAAGAGAPVSNMTSAYGGIRWGSGVTRQFQYEQGQSRIGTDLWSGFDKYYANSPLFFVPNVKTPVLIMHNDKDTAVPWYQGIEFFTALKRCSKQAWMLQYKGEDHNLRLRHNCKDLSVKLGEFFDHFLKGTPEPDWMKNN